MSPKAKAIGAGVLLAAALVFAISRLTREDTNALPSKATLVCVETGETFNIPMERVKRLPETNPATGRRTLLPVYRDDAGVLLLDRHTASLLDDLTTENHYVDRETLRVREN